MLKALLIAAAIVLLVLVILFGEECWNGADDLAIEIVPYQVNVGSEPVETTFELEARLWSGPSTDRRSIIEPQEITWWATEPWLTVKSQSGFKAIIEVLPGAPTAGSAYVRAKAGGATSEPSAKVSLVPAVMADGDLLSSKYIQDKSPDAVIVNGIFDAAGTPCKVTLGAFVRRSMVGKLVDPCSGENGGWGAAVLATNHRLLFPPASWSPPANVVPVGALQLPMRSLPVALRVMLGSSLLDAATLTALRSEVRVLAEDEIKATNTILAESRAGVQLAIHDLKVIDDVPDLVIVSDCRSGDALTGEYDDPGVLNLYYVDDLTGNRGLACGWHQGRQQDVIYIGMDLHSVSSFPHELGHTLGLTMPGFGHTELIEGVDRTNIMTSGENDLDPGGRRRLTAGQVFRMNADSASWLNWAVDPSNPDRNLIREREAPRLACQCGEEDPTGQCPRLREDVAIPSSVPGAAETWDCVDRLRLSGVSGEEPVALLAGRRWRAPPGTCSTDLPGSAGTRWGATYVKFDNLARSGACQSWVAIFFKQHGVKYLELADDAYTWTTVAEEWTVPDEMVPPIKIDVRVFYESENDGIVEQDIGHSLNTFGGSNRSGIELEFEKNPQIDCPTTAPSWRELYLCYRPAGAEEARLVGSTRILVSTPKRRNTTVSHFIGRALGLKPLPGTAAGFRDNIMHSAPGKRGQKLTLGQVFRVYAGFDPGLECDPGPCPSLRAD